MYSVDGIKWNAIPGLTGNSYSDVAYGNGRYVICDVNGGKFYASKDFTEWHPSIQEGEPFKPQRVVYGHGIFMATTDEKTIFISGDYNALGFEDLFAMVQQAQALSLSRLN